MNMITIDELKRRYNNIMLDLGYEHLCIGKEYDMYDCEEQRQIVNNYDVKEIYKELKYWLETFDDSDHANSTCEPKWRRSVTGKIKRLINRIELGVRAK